MPAQRSIMKSRGSASNNRLSRRLAFPAAAVVMTIVFMAMAAASSCPVPLTEAAPLLPCAAEEGTDLQEQDRESGSAMDPERGTLILEDPKEKTPYAEYEMAVGDGFSITFTHSVNKSPVTDYFVVREDGIYGVKTVYYGFGAGVPTEPEEGQTLTYGEDGSMILSGLEVKMDNLIYRVGTVSDHILTLEDGSGISLRELCGRSARVGFRFEGG